MFAHFALILRDPVLRLAAAASLTFGCFAASIGPYQSLIAVREFHLSNGAYAAVLIGALVVAVLTAIGVGILTDQRPSRRRMADPPGRHGLRQDPCPCPAGAPAAAAR